MGRRRSTRAANTLRLRGAERVLFIFGAIIYVIGLFGGLNLLDIPVNTTTLLLVLGGGLLLVVNLVILF